MSGHLIIITGLIYAYIAGEQLVKENPHMAIVYAGYAFSNVGLYLLSK
jgi:alcohol dehydrogenase class IV